MDAAVQHFHGTIQVFPNPEAVLPQPVLQPVAFPIGRSALTPSATARMTTVSKPREFFIQGITSAGKTFRPSDWAERLAGALSNFRPKSGQLGSGIGSHIGYSPYCVPRVIGNTKCVIVNEALRDLEPMAWDFVMHFARDNDLQVVEACLVQPPPAA